MRSLMTQAPNLLGLYSVLWQEELICLRSRGQWRFRVVVRFWIWMVREGVESGSWLEVGRTERRVLCKLPERGFMGVEGAATGVDVVVVVWEGGRGALLFLGGIVLQDRREAC